MKSEKWPSRVTVCLSQHGSGSWHMRPSTSLRRKLITMAVLIHPYPGNYLSLSLWPSPLITLPIINLDMWEKIYRQCISPLPQFLAPLVMDGWVGCIGECASQQDKMYTEYSLLPHPQPSPIRHLLPHTISYSYRYHLSHKLHLLSHTTSHGYRYYRLHSWWYFVRGRPSGRSGTTTKNDANKYSLNIMLLLFFVIFSFALSSKVWCQKYKTAD